MTSKTKFNDPWDELTQFTGARIARGRAGGSLPTSELLHFNFAHAQAQDAVHSMFEADLIADHLQNEFSHILFLQSMADDRLSYLQDPPLGRALNSESRKRLMDFMKANPAEPDVVFIVSDGLSARAATENAPTLLRQLKSLLSEKKFKVGPLILVSQGRVAIEDDIGVLCKAKTAVILLGERPGLGSPDSLGAYLVYGPEVGKTDADRNCISNIRNEGLKPEFAAQKIVYLLSEALRRKLSGVQLKDESLLPDAQTTQRISP